MTKDQIREALTSLSVNRRGMHQAPHKPLLVLYMLAHYWRGGKRKVRFGDINDPLRHLVRQQGYAASNQGDAALKPFWHMHSEEDLWERTGHKHLVTNRAANKHDRPRLIDARNSETFEGGFKQEIYEKLREDRGFLIGLIFTVLDDYFPVHKHGELLRAVGIPDGNPETDLPNNESLVRDVLKAYRHKCAICEFSNNFYGKEASLKAAEIQWESANGPETIVNRILLCTLHNDLFNEGAFTLSQEYRLVVSSRFTNSRHGGNSRLLTAYEGKPAKTPTSRSKCPDYEHLEWHRGHVFKR